MAMTDIQTLCVFCSSSNRVPAYYRDSALRIADLCAARGWSLVYGGSRGGLMGAVADAALAQGVFVTGVIPHHLHDREVAHSTLSELHIVSDMHERQMKMANLSDAFLVLPGGLGTLAELFEIVTWRQIGLHQKPVFLLNDRGYWDDLISMLGKAQKEGFLYGDFQDTIKVVGCVSEIAHLL